MSAQQKSLANLSNQIFECPQVQALHFRSCLFKYQKVWVVEQITLLHQLVITEQNITIQLVHLQHTIYKRAKQLVGQFLIEKTTDSRSTYFFLNIQIVCPKQKMLHIGHIGIMLRDVAYFCLFCPHYKIFFDYLDLRHKQTQPHLPQNPLFPPLVSQSILIIHLLIEIVAPSPFSKIDASFLLLYQTNEAPPFLLTKQPLTFSPMPKPNPLMP